MHLISSLCVNFKYLYLTFLLQSRIFEAQVKKKKIIILQEQIYIRITKYLSKNTSKIKTIFTLKFF